jgi:hypothetical protein
MYSQAGAMRILLFCAGIFSLALRTATATRQLEEQDPCRFKISESTTKPAIAGPSDVVTMIIVIEQPDSPVEILAMDFKDFFVF